MSGAGHVGHCSILLTADTSTSALLAVAHQAADQVAARVCRVEPDGTEEALGRLRWSPPGEW